MSELYRRSPFLVCYWQEGQLTFENYATLTRVSAAPITFDILNCFSEWCPAATLAHNFPQFSARSLTRALFDLICRGLIERSSAPHHPQSEALATWKDWSPAASYFHMSTKDSHAPIEPEDSVRKLRRRAQAHPMPPPLKSYPEKPQISLPAPGDELILQDEIGEATYQLDDQKKAQGFEGKNVKVTGTVDEVTKTIHVASIEPEH